MLPPLREREGDVLELADHFLAHAAERLGRDSGQHWNPRRASCSQSYSWPGNVRELQNIITRACVLNQGQPISASELRPWLREEALTKRGARSESRKM